MVSPKINPVMTTEQKVMIGAVALGGLAAIYYVFKGSSTTTTTTAPPSGPVVPYGNPSGLPGL